MRAGFSHLPVKPDLNKFNMMISYKCRKIFLFVHRSCCYTLLLTLYFIKIPIKGFLSPSLPTSGGGEAADNNTDCKLQMLIFARLTRKAGALLELQPDIPTV